MKKIIYNLHKYIHYGNKGLILSKRLYDMGCRTRLDLLRHIKSNNLPKLPLLSKIYILYSPQKRTSYQESLNIIKKLKKNINNMKIIPVGSIRRKQNINTDIDLLLVVKELKYINLSNNNLILVEGKKTFNPRHQKYIFKVKNKNYLIDIFICVKKELPFMLFHYTGSKLYNIRTRFYAKNKGLLLNQYGLWIKNSKNPNKKISAINKKIKTEKDLICFLGISYKKPIDRNK